MRGRLAEPALPRASARPRRRGTRTRSPRRVAAAARRRCRCRRRPGSRAGRAGRSRRVASSRNADASQLPRSGRRATRRRGRGARSASGGVPHAGQPSTPNTVTSLPAERAPQRVAERADRGVILEHEHGVDARSTSSASQSRSTALSHGMLTTASPKPVLGEELRRERAPRAASPARTRRGPRPSPSRRTRAAARLERSPGELDPARRRPDREPDRDVLLRLLDRPAQRAPASPRRSPAARSSCSEARRAARCRARSGATCPGPAGISPA